MGWVMHVERWLPAEIKATLIISMDLTALSSSSGSQLKLVLIIHDMGIAADAMVRGE